MGFIPQPMGEEMIRGMPFQGHKGLDVKRRFKEVERGRAGVGAFPAVVMGFSIRVVVVPGATTIAALGYDTDGTVRGYTSIAGGFDAATLEVIDRAAGTVPRRGLGTHIAIEVVNR